VFRPTQLVSLSRFGGGPYRGARAWQSPSPTSFEARRGAWGWVCSATPAIDRSALMHRAHNAPAKGVRHRPSRAPEGHFFCPFGGYSTTTILPTESVAEFEELHEDLISELVPNGALADDIVATITQMVWRKRRFRPC
jgi:hypothetical protein